MTEFDDDRVRARRPARACGSSAPRRPRPRSTGRRAPTRDRARRMPPPSGAVARRRPTDVQPAARFPLPPPTASSDRATIPDRRSRPAAGAAARPEASGEPHAELPHWTEPATGEVPMIADEAGDEDVEPTRRVDEPRSALPSRPTGRRRLETSRARATTPRTTRPPRSARSSTLRPRSTTTRCSPRGRGPPGAPRAAAARAARRVAVPRAAAGSQSRPRTTDAPRSPRRATAVGDDLTTRIITGVGIAALALLCFDARPRRHRGARHRDRRGCRVRALRGLPPRRVPARPRSSRCSASVAIVRHRVQPRRVRVPAGHRDRDRLHAALVPVRGRARAPDGQRRGHHAAASSTSACSAASPGLLLVFPERRRHRSSASCSARWATTSSATSSARSSGKRPLVARRSRRTRRSRAWSAAWPPSIVVGVLIVNVGITRGTTSADGLAARPRRWRSSPRSATSSSRCSSATSASRTSARILPGSRRRARPLRRHPVLPAGGLLPGRSRADDRLMRRSRRRDASLSSARRGRSARRRSTSSAATATTTRSSALAAGRNAELLAAQAAEFGVARRPRPALCRRRARGARRARRARPTSTSC